MRDSSSTDLVTQLIDQSCKCVRCGKPMTVGCKCWKKVLLHCPRCKRSLMALPEATDPPGTYKIIMPCDHCADARFKIRYYDKNRREIKA